MVHLPLFPLNTVLFPGMPLQLHIFEERYKLMINECIDTKTAFGVVLIESGQEAFAAPPQPHLIGCTAQITQVQKLPFGRMNILAIGRERFRIARVHQDKPYLSGEVEMLPFRDPDPRTSSSEGHRLIALVQKYVARLQEGGQIQIKPEQLPRDPAALGFLSAVILQIENTQKQKLLEIIDTSEFLKELVAVYRREVTLLDIMLQAASSSDSDEGAFSLN